MDYYFLSQTSLFKNIEIKAIPSILETLGYEIKEFEKDETIFRIGEQIEMAGIILSGTVHLERVDFLGNKVIISIFRKGQTFGVTYAVLKSEKLMSSVIADGSCSILFINFKNLLFNDIEETAWSQTIIRNLLFVAYKKNVSLLKKIIHTSPRKIRERLFSYLSDEILKNNSFEFDIPLDRQAFSDYLSVDRSALSNELSRLRKEGILTCKKNHFSINGRF